MAETGTNMTLIEEDMEELTEVTPLAIAVLVIPEMIILVALIMEEGAIILTDQIIIQQRITKGPTTPIWAIETMRELVTIMRGREIQMLVVVMRAQEVQVSVATTAVLAVLYPLEAA